MTKKLWVILPLCLIATLAVGFMSVRTNPSVIEVEQEFPVRAALHQRTLPGHRGAYGERTTPDVRVDSATLESEAEEMSTADADIIGTAAKFEKFSTLIAAAKATGLVEVLRSANDVTIFAPTDRAFARLPEPVFEQLLRPENVSMLRKWLADHIVPKKLVWSDLFGRRTQLRTLSGRLLIAEGTSGVYVNGVRVSISDVLATNGVIHVVDRLIRPSTEDASVM